MIPSGKVPGQRHTTSMTPFKQPNFICSESIQRRQNGASKMQQPLAKLVYTSSLLKVGPQIVFSATNMLQNPVKLLLWRNENHVTSDNHHISIFNVNYRKGKIYTGWFTGGVRAPQNASCKRCYAKLIDTWHSSAQILTHAWLRHQCFVFYQNYSQRFSEAKR